MESYDFTRPAPILHRLVPALRLEGAFYAAAARDVASRGPALMVVLMAETLNGIRVAQGAGPLGLMGAVILGVARWYLWVLVVRGVAWGGRCRCDQRSLTRPLGYAHAPTLFFCLAMIPELSPFVRAAVPLWLLATTSVAVQAAYLTSTPVSIVIALIAFAIYVAIGAVVALPLL